MNTNRKIAVAVGILYIIGTAAGILSVVLTMSIMDAPDYLGRIFENQNLIIIGALCILTMGLALAMIPAVIYPVFRKYNPTLAVGYVIFRGGLETFTYLIGSICWLSLIGLSQAFGKTGAPDVSNFYVLGGLLKQGALIGSNLTAIVFPLGAMMLYIFLYQSKLIPRWLSVWGMIAVGLNFISTGIMPMFGIVGSWSAIQAISNVPIFLQEMVMAVWLIVRGFSLPLIASMQEK
jgi:hypothetical protein